jgi:hypothetical protein
MKRWKVNPKEKYNGKTMRQWRRILKISRSTPPPLPVEALPPPLPVVDPLQGNQEMWLCNYCDRPFGQHPENTLCPDARLRKWLDRESDNHLDTLA